MTNDHEPPTTDHRGAAGAAPSCSAQERYATRTGHVSFHSDTPMENIEADNYKVTSVIDATTGAVEFAVLMKAFEFEKALMQEHFNENYVESNTYPKADLQGQGHRPDRRSS